MKPYLYFTHHTHTRTPTRKHTCTLPRVNLPFSPLFLSICPAYPFSFASKIWKHFRLLSVSFHLSWCGGSTLFSQVDKRRDEMRGTKGFPGFYVGFLGRFWQSGKKMVYSEFYTVKKLVPQCSPCQLTKNSTVTSWRKISLCDFEVQRHNNSIVWIVLADIVWK